MGLFLILVNLMRDPSEIDDVIPGRNALAPLFSRTSFTRNVKKECCDPYLVNYGTKTQKSAEIEVIHFAYFNKFKDS